MERALERRVEQMSVVRGGDVAAAFRLELVGRRRAVRKDASLASAGVLHHRGDRAELAPRGERGAGTGGCRRVRRVGRLATVPRARVDRRGTADGVNGRRARRCAGGAPRRRRAELRAGGPPDHGKPRAAERPTRHVGRLLRRVPAPPVGPSGRRLRGAPGERDRAARAAGDHARPLRRRSTRQSPPRRSVGRQPPRRPIRSGAG